MDSNTVIVVLANAPEYDEETVKMAIREAASGQHGEFLQAVIQALLLEHAKENPNAAT